MKFHPSEEQLAIQDAIRGTLADTLPMARLQKLFDDDGPDFDKPSWDALMALGLGGLALPEQYGGSALELIDLALAVEMLGQGAAPGPIVQHLLAGLAIAASDDEDAKAKWLPKLATGEIVATLAIGGDWFPDSWDVRESNGSLTGKVAFVPGAGSADLFVVGTAGGGFALVEKGEGVAVTPVRSSDRSRRLSSVEFDSAPATILFAAGAPGAQKIFDAALVLSTADALGGAQYCVDRSVAYAKERQQFNQPIGRFQGLKHQLATMALEIEPARALMWYAAYAQDADLPDAARTASLAKAHIADRFVSVTRAAVAAHGGIGYTWEYGLNIWFRKAMFDRAYLGSPARHRARAADLAGW